VPALVLTYFSVQNIMGLKELSEKRLVEAQNKLADHLQKHARQILSDCSILFFQKVDSLPNHSASLHVLRDSLDFVEQVFLISKNGDFLFPRFREDIAPGYYIMESNRFIRMFKIAEAAEFAELDFRKASESYSAAMELADNDFEAASALNGLARVLVKKGLFRQAFSNYGNLAAQYGSSIDKTGTPFVHYALYQIMRLSRKLGSRDVINVMESILSGFTLSKFPISSQTANVLESIVEWCAKQDSAMVTIDNILIKVDRIQKDLKFIQQYSNDIKTVLMNPGPQTYLDSYAVLKSNSDTDPYLILMNRSDGSAIPGFKFNLNYLKEKLAVQYSQQTHYSDFNYTIVQTDEISPLNMNPLTTVRELNPLISGWSLIIEQRDPKALNRTLNRQKWMYAIAIVSLIGGMILGILLILRDISREQKLAELRSDFVSNVTHELKTPLTSIRMYAETMLMGRIKKHNVQKEYLSVIVHESERLTRLINTVLDFSKIEQNEKRYTMEKIDLSQVVEHGLSAIAYYLKEQGFTVSTEIRPGLRITGDRDALEQALLNLVSNSMKYSGDRKKIMVRLYKAGSSVHLEVEDRGFGIPEEKQAFVFDKYYRAHQRHKKQREGSGLGLTVVKHIVEAHGGQIELKSKVDEGSTFRIILPIT